jgi:hypothetical protein
VPVKGFKKHLKKCVEGRLGKMMEKMAEDMEM